MRSWPELLTMKSNRFGSTEQPTFHTEPPPPPPQPPPSPSNDGQGDDTQSGWEDPKPISYELLPVAKMLPEMLPEPLRAWLVDEAERMQCPLDFLAASAICGLSGLIGAGCGICPKQLDNWIVVPNLWGGLIGRPGSKKTPAMNAVLRLIRELEKVSGEIFKVQETRHKADMMEFKAKQKALESKIEAAATWEPSEDPDDVGPDIEALKEEYAKLKPPAAPIWRRYMTQNATIEKLAELMASNSRGLIVQQDELIALLAQWEREDHRTDRGFHLQAWSGDVGYITDRIGRGTINTPQLCEAIVGGTQPTKLMVYLAQAKGNKENDGLLQRFQVFVYPDDLPGAPVDRLPDFAARGAAELVFQSLARMDFVAYGAECVEGSKIPFVRFTAEAQAFFNDWHLALMTKREGDMEGLMLEHYSKYDSLLPSLALIFQLVEIALWDARHFIGSDSAPPIGVSLENAKRAAEWCSYLESHALRIYGLASDLSTQAADKLLRKIRKGEIQNNFSALDVYAKNWALLDSKESAKVAIDVLVDTGWLREVLQPRPTGRGRPRASTYQVHPSIRQRA
jgi:hypothetical protein